MNKLIVSALCSAGAVAMAPQVQAQALPTQYVAILLDGSGSMLSNAFVQTQPGMPATPARTKWREGLDRAMQRVLAQKTDVDQMPTTDPNWFINEEDHLNVPPTTDTKYPPAIHCYSIHIFAGSSVTKVFPSASSGLTFQCAATSTGAKDPAVYEAVRTTLNNLAAPASASITTPLADGLCDVLDKTYTQAGAGENARSIILESDGMENSSSVSACVGSSTGTFNPTLVNSSFPAFLAWAGGLPNTSWMYKVYNKAFNNDPNFYPNPTATPPWPVSSVRGLRVDPNISSFTHFWNEAFGLNDLAFARTQSRAAIVHVDALYDFIPTGATAASVAASTAATFPEPLKNYLKGMSWHSRGRFQRIQYNANKLPGAAHNPPGDVDDSGCVTTADLNHIRQPDTWLRPSNATPHTRLCDANRDGWVNNYDVNVVMPRLNTCRPGCTLSTNGSCVK